MRYRSLLRWLLLVALLPVAFWLGRKTAPGVSNEAAIYQRLLQQTEERLVVAAEEGQATHLAAVTLQDHLLKLHSRAGRGPESHQDDKGSGQEDRQREVSERIDAVIRFWKIAGRLAAGDKSRPRTASQMRDEATKLLLLPVNKERPVQAQILGVGFPQAEMSGSEDRQ